MRHSIPISASFNLFNYITVTPNITYNERWHTSSYRKHWDDERNEVVTDTVYGFNRNYDFSGGHLGADQALRLLHPVPQMVRRQD